MPDATDLLAQARSRTVVVRNDDDLERLTAMLLELDEAEILSGKRKIDVSIAAKLGGFFHVPSELFVERPK